MNIFVVSEDPIDAAQMLCDQHVVKMILESFQILATVLRFYHAPESCLPRTQKDTPFRSTHAHHPCVLWARASRGNYDWLVQHAWGLCREYTYRYKKQHALESYVARVRDGRTHVPDGPRTPFVLAMPAQYKENRKAVDAYRSFYVHEKSSFARWRLPERRPTWFAPSVSV